MKEIRQLRGQVAAREVKPADYLARRTAILLIMKIHGALSARSKIVHGIHWGILRNIIAR